MPFDLESALGVKERDDGLFEKVGNFDLASAVPAVNIPEIRAAKPEERRYQPELTPEQKAQAVVERSYKEGGEKVPFGLKADWLLTSPKAQAVTQAGLAFELTVLQGIRGAIQNTGQYDLLGNILKGIVEPEKTKKFFQNIPGSERLPMWAQTVAGVAEDIAGLGFIGFGKAVLKKELLAKDVMFKIDTAAEQFTDDAVSVAVEAVPDAARAEIKNGFKARMFRFLTAVEPEITASDSALGTGQGAAPPLIEQYARRRSLLGLIIEDFKRMGKVGELQLPKVGQAVNFINPEGAVLKGIIKEIAGERAIIDIAGKDVVATLGQLTWVSRAAPGNVAPGEAKKKPDLSNLPQLQKQIKEMEDRTARVEISQNALDEINTVRQYFRRRLQYHEGGFQREEAKGIPSYYITSSGGIKPDQALEELKTNFNIELNTEDELRDYLKNLEETKHSLEAEIEIEKPGFITKKETTLLKDKVKAAEMGFRTGVVKTKEEVKALQGEFISAIEDLNVPTSDKWRIIKAIKNVQTPEQFSRVLNDVTLRLSNIQDKAERMGTIGDIKKLFIKQPAESLPLHYKDQIEVIKDKIDPRQRSEATQKKIESMREFVKRMEEEGEDINIPEYKLALLDKTSLEDLSLGELGAIKETISQLYHQGKTYNKLLTSRQDKEFSDVVKKIVSDILKGKDLSADSSFVKAIREHNKSLTGASLDAVRDFIYANLRPELMINMLGLEPTETIFKPLAKADTTEIADGEAHTKKLWNSQQMIDISKAYIKKFDVGSYKGITKNNALFIYANSKNDAQLAHLYASGITDEDIKLFSDFLTIDEKQAVEQLWAYYDKEQWPRLDTVYSKINGAHISKEDNYFPIMNLEDVAESYSKELESEMMKRFHLKQATPAKGFTRERMQSKKAFSNFDYFGTIIKNHEQVEHYIAFAEAIRDANKIMRNPDVRQAIVQKNSKEYLRILDNWLKDVAYGGDRAINNMLDRFASFLTQNYVTAVLGYNVLSASKSLVSFLTGVDRIGSQEVVRSLGKYMQHPVKWTQFVYSKSEMMKHRDFTQEKEFKSILAGREALLGQAKLWQKFKEWSSVPMMISDKVTVIPLWMAAYQDVMDKGSILTDQELEQKAVEAADTLIRRTQPMGRALHLPETFRGGAFQRAYTLFTNQLNQNFNREYEQTKGFLDKEVKTKDWLKTQLTLVVLSGLMIGLIQRRRLPTLKEMIYDSISQLSGGVFLIGTLADAIAMAMFTKQRANIERALMPKSFGALTELGYAAVSKTGWGRLKHITAAAGALAGFPYIQSGRVIQTLEDVTDFIGEGL